MTNHQRLNTLTESLLYLKMATDEEMLAVVKDIPHISELVAKRLKKAIAAPTPRISGRAVKPKK